MFVQNKQYNNYYGIKHKLEKHVDRKVFFLQSPINVSRKCFLTFKLNYFDPLGLL